MTLYKCPKYGLDKIDLIVPIAAKVKPNGPAGHTRGHSQKLSRETFSAADSNDFASGVARREHFLSNCVVPLWNSFPDAVVRAPDLKNFKRLVA